MAKRNGKITLEKLARMVERSFSHTTQEMQGLATNKSFTNRLLVYARK